MYEVTTLAGEIDRSLWQERLTAVLATCLGVYAVPLTAIGLYGMLAYLVAQRRREIGIRLALGADARDTFIFVFRRIVVLLGFGLAGSIVLYMIGGKYLASILYGVNLIDLPAIGAALLLICAASFMSAVIPWLRATRTNPALILRED
jgi:ABC-type antimicrobial peptide transport system permease subunit